MRKPRPLMPSPAGRGDATATRTLPALRLFRLISGAVRAHYARIEAESGVPAAEVRLLAAIAEPGGEGVDRLAARLALHKSTVSNLAGKLVRKRLALRERAAGDLRSVRLSVSPAGRALLRRAPQPAGGLMQTILEGLTPSELRQVEEALQLLAGRLPPGMDRYARQSLTADVPAKEEGGKE